VGGAPDAAAADARTLYDAGTAAFAARSFVEAALAFEAAATKKPSPISLYTAALSWERARNPDRAADAYSRALAIPGLPPDKMGPARDELASLERTLGAVVVTAPVGLRVALDAHTEVFAPATLHGAPGPHTLVIWRDAQTTERVPVLLTEGQATRMDLSATSTPVSAHDVSSLPPTKSTAGGDLRRILGVAALGGGGMAALAGVLAPSL
jgi:hypothetical protein